MAAHEAHRGGAVDGLERDRARVFHCVSSPAGPDQGDGHLTRPPVTIRKRCTPAAMVGLLVGSTMISRSRLAGLRTADCAALVDGAHGLCALDRDVCVFGLCTVQWGQVPSRSQCQERTSGWRRVAAHPAPRFRTDVRAVRGPSGPSVRDLQRRRMSSLDLQQIRGWGCGWADHGPNHDVCVLIVTVVGLWWSVVGSG